LSEQQDQIAEQSVGAFTLADPLSSPPPTPLPYPVPEPDAEWELPGGFAHVFYGKGNSGLTRPVIMADGFNLGPSDLKWLYAGLDRDYPFLSKLRESGRDVILIGFDERSASILANAEAVTVAVFRAIAERRGDARLMVGGFSMGGIIARYALAKLETQRMDHQTAAYFSYDSPHRGAVVPIGLQAFAHFIPIANDFARQMDSAAARQLFWRHYDPETGEIGVAPEREEFLEALRRVGWWPRIPRLLGLANGRGDGTGLDVKPGEIALKVGKIYPGTTFYTQAQGDNVTVAELKRKFPKAEKTITTSGFPELDAAPGGTLRSFGILADMLKKFGAEVDLRHADVGFVPSVSALAIRDIDEQKNLYADISSLDPNESELDDIIWSSTNTAHTAVTQELSDWLLERLPR
jgi:pimeloyl-ACP methyl ester carboxylesterase